MADLSLDPGMQPMTVTATLAAGFAVGAGWGIALDGLLAGALWAHRKAGLRAAGTRCVRLVDQQNPPDLPLPLARCVAGGPWHWAATCAAPVDADDEHPRDVRTWTGRVDERICRQLVDGTPGTLTTHHGRWRNRMMPVVVTLCRAVQWRAVGRPDQVAQLVAPIAAIGKKRSQGDGAVLSWDVQADPTGDPAAFAHLHHDGTLGRPATSDCVPDGVIHGGHGRAGLRPPYTHPSRQAELLLPLPLD